MTLFQIEPTHYARLFFLSILLGILFGLYYEIFRFARALFPSPAPVVFFEDLLFWLPIAPTVVFFCYALSDGILRWFSAAGMILGFFLYRQTAGRLLFRAYSAAIGAIRRALKKAFYAVFSPVKAFFAKNIKRHLLPIRNFVILKKEKYLSKRAARLAAKKEGENADEGTSGIFCEARSRGDPRFSRDLHRE